MNFTIQARRPRNPLVALTRARKAGSHRPSIKSSRQTARDALRRELSRSSDPQHSP